jgi:hypothetical protein
VEHLWTRRGNAWWFDLFSIWIIVWIIILLYCLCDSNSK